MPRPFRPRVGPEVYALRPDYCALSLVASDVRNLPHHPASETQVEAVRGLATWPDWGDGHVEAWREAYRGFGAKPQRTPPSVESLVARLRRAGELPRINAVVDLYNALSVRYALPIGGENAAAYSSDPLLRRATGQETFDTARDAAPLTESVPIGEVVWTDTGGVTCRRWNWRQGQRTRIDLATTRMWFVLERLEPMPMHALLEAGRALAVALRQLSPGTSIEATILDRLGETPLAEADGSAAAGDEAAR